jgi:hypothetical protein
MFPNGEEVKDAERSAFEDKAAGLRFAAAKLNLSQTTYYDARGTRYPALTTEGAAEGTKAELTFPVVVPDLYTVNLYLLKGPAWELPRAAEEIGSGECQAGFEALGTFEAAPKSRSSFSPSERVLDPGPNTIIFDVAAATPGSRPGYRPGRARSGR